MIDKCRAVLAGTEGEYRYPCPIDELVMECAGITSEAFTATVITNPTDEGVETWFGRTAKPHEAAEVAAWNRSCWRGAPPLRKAQSGSRYLTVVDPSRTDITSWADLQDLEQGVGELRPPTG